MAPTLAASTCSTSHVCSSSDVASSRCEAVGVRPAAVSADISARESGERTSMPGTPPSSDSGPLRTSRPRAMITTSSTVCWTSESTWLDTSTVRPCDAR